MTEVRKIRRRVLNPSIFTSLLICQHQKLRYIFIIITKVSSIMDHQITNAVNALISVLLLLKTTHHFIIGNTSGQTGSIYIELLLFKATSVVQLLDIGLSLADSIRVILRVLPKLILAFVYLSDETDETLFLRLTLISSGFQVLKYLSQVFPQVSFLRALRLNLPRLMGLVVPLLHFLLLNDYIYINAERIKISSIQTIRIIQLCLLVAAAVSYWLELRAKDSLSEKQKVQ